MMSQQEVLIFQSQEKQKGHDAWKICRSDCQLKMYVFKLKCKNVCVVNDLFLLFSLNLAIWHLTKI